jgi:PAS domain S-box-containing protein
MDTIPHRLFWKDREFSYLGCNRIFAKDAGLQSPEEIAGMNDFELSWKESAPLYRADDMEVMERDISKINYEEEQIREDGSRLWLRTTKLPIKNEQGEIIGVFGSYEDITAQKLAEEKAQQLELQLQQSQKMEALGTLAGGIAHDFNNILTAITGFSHLVSEELAESDPRRQDLKQVTQAAERGRQLIQRILTFSRAESADTAIVSFHEVLEDTVAFLRASIPATIQLNSNINCRDGYLEGNEGDIHQLVVNLATNAAHAMERAGGLLSIDLNLEDSREAVAHLYGTRKKGRYFHLSVADTGEGIDKKDIARIFDPFFTTKETGRGTGLGLSVVHGIVKRLEGAIDVWSQRGSGTRFDIYIPCYEGEVAPESVGNSMEAHGDERILLVDDEDPLAELEKRILEKMGYSVDAYTSPLAALGGFNADPGAYDVVVTDLTMPDLTGIDLIREIRRIRKTIPVVLVSGFNDEMTREAAAREDIFVFVRKPLLARNLSRGIRSAIDNAGRTK